MFEQLGLNSSSRLEATRERVDFNFSFTSSAKESLSASGYVERREQHASLTLNYTFERAVVVDGKRELRTFQASLLFEADTSQSLSVKPFKEKEDIMHFLNRIVNDIFDLLQDDSQVLTGITLDQKDLAEVMNLDHGKAKRMFDGLMSAIMTMAMLKRMKRGSDAGPNVILNEKRKETTGIQAEKASSAQFSFSLSIKEVAVGQSGTKTSQIAAAGAEQSVSGSAAAQSAPAPVAAAPVAPAQAVSVSAA